MHTESNSKSDNRTCEQIAAENVVLFNQFQIDVGKEYRNVNDKQKYVKNIENDKDIVKMAVYKQLCIERYVPSGCMPKHNPITQVMPSQDKMLIFMPWTQRDELCSEKRIGKSCDSRFINNPYYDNWFGYRLDTYFAMEILEDFNVEKGDIPYIREISNLSL